MRHNFMHCTDESRGFLLRSAAERECEQPGRTSTGRYTPTMPKAKAAINHDPGPQAAGERGDKAWSDRLAAQAANEQAQAQAQRANAAYAARYAGQTQSFYDLIRQADAARVERANKAWSDRLTAQAEYFASK